MSTTEANLQSSQLKKTAPNIYPQEMNGDAVTLIAKNLTWREYVNLTCASKTITDSAEENEIWRNYYQRRFPGESIPLGSTYKKAFKNRHLNSKKIHPLCLCEETSQELKNDKAFILAAVKESSWALEYASDTLKNDKEVVLAAVKQNGCAFQYASEKLKNDPEIVLEALKQNPDAVTLKNVLSMLLYREETSTLVLGSLAATISALRGNGFFTSLAIGATVSASSYAVKQSFFAKPTKTALQARTHSEMETNPQLGMLQ